MLLKDVLPSLITNEVSVKSHFENSLNRYAIRKLITMMKIMRKSEFVQATIDNLRHNAVRTFSFSYL